MAKSPSSGPESRIAEGFTGQRLVIVPRDRLSATKALPVIRDLQVTHIGHFGPARNHFVKRLHGTAEHILIYCLAGKGECRLGNRQWPVAAGDAVILPPGKTHSYLADPADPWTIFWFHFKGTRAADYVAALGLEADNPILHSPRPNALRQAFEESYRHALHGFNDSSLLGLSTGLARLVGLLRIYSRPRGLRMHRTEDRVLAAIRRMQAEPTRDWSLDELAGEAGMSSPYFCEVFRKQVGCAPKQFAIRQRMQIACALMQEANLTVAEVAARLGYDDAYYFSRLFSRHIGQSPQAYRREVKGISGAGNTSG
ncbi:AraC family transcriptional regulator [Luteolibacter luteus]|uniref:AraC family transcriptional regulator n=1 Tax=Luteolibacter luteus TaxID=2728835 RepID=A0A858RF40_9BACT|nr:AraC family transcriptional regulator [Luteolibacter luteus]QJE95716.1 AraC family transcriptional regulator [Luteolibacter luteus]